MALQDKHDTKLIIYMNIKTNIMTFKLKTDEVNQLKNLIYDYIDRIGGFDQLSDELKAVLDKIRVINAKKVSKERSTL